MYEYVKYAIFKPKLETNKVRKNPRFFNEGEFVLDVVSNPGGGLEINGKERLLYDVFWG